MKQRSVGARAIYYIILAALCAAVPYLLTILLVLITQDRARGIALGVIPSIVVVHIIFSLIFLRTRLWIKLVFPFITAILCIFGLKLLLPLDIINTGLDMYGYWDIVITHFIVAKIIWEIMYHLLRYATKPAIAAKSE